MAMRPNSNRGRSVTQESGRPVSPAMAEPAMQPAAQPAFSRQYQSPSAAAAPAAAKRPAAPSHEQTALRARAIWQKKGCPQGQDETIWHQAEAELRKEAGAR